MKPSDAMGLFLRTWRAEWAGITRQQLGLALSAYPDVRVTDAVVRHWEQGQPPASTAEFDALLDVMSRHGLTRPEIDDVRRAILAAVCDRQYADLFPDEDFAYRDDVVDVAWRLQGEVSHPRERNVVNLVCRVHELRSAIAEGATSKPGRDRLHEQQVALIWMREALACRVWSRPLQTSQLHAGTHRLLHEFFGSRPPHPASPHKWLSAAASARMVGLHTADDVPRLLELARRAREAGDDWDYYWLHGVALNGAASFGTPEMCTYLRSQSEQWLRLVETLTDWPELLLGARDMLCAAAIRDGTLDEAERLLMDVHPVSGFGVFNFNVPHRMAQFAEARGDYDEAIEHYERHLDLAMVWDHPGKIEDNRRAIERCDRARMKASRRRQRPAVPPHGKASTETPAVAPSRSGEKRGGAAS